MEDVTNPTTAWQRIALDIVQKIRAGATPVGSRIPSYRRLTVDYDTSLGTVKRAVEYLQEQGIVKGVQGSAVFVVRVPDEDPTFVPNSPEDVAGRLGRLEEEMSALQNGHQDMREKFGSLQAALRDLYARTGNRYPGTGSQPAQPRRSRREAADG